MMRTWPLLFLATALIVPPLVAQDMDNAPQRAALRDRIENAFLTRAKEEMGLTDQQSAKLLEVTRREFQKRQELAAANMRLNGELSDQMRPGVAADPRAIRTIIDSLVQIRVSGALLYQDEQHELAGFLTDLQRAQFHILRERFLDRLQSVRAERAPLMRRRP